MGYDVHTLEDGMQVLRFTPRRCNACGNKLRQEGRTVGTPPCEMWSSRDVCDCCTDADMRRDLNARCGL